MSVAGETPDELKYFPSSTQRACFTHFTFVAQENACLLVVAFMPSSSPVFARTAAPVGTDATWGVASASCFAAALEVKDGTLVNIRLAMGGVAHKPWRASEAERFLLNKQPSVQLFQAAASLEMEAAKPLEHNGFKGDRFGNAAFLHSIL